MAPRQQTRPPVLVVDDDPAIQEVIGATLRDAGFTVLAALTYADALLALATVRVGLVLADPPGQLLRPPSERWVQLEALRYAAAGAPVVILTARNPALFAAYAPRGFAGLLGKPFDIDALMRLVWQLVPAGPR